MRNQFPGICYRCNTHVATGDGHFERFLGKWRVQHATCAIEHRGGPPDPAREAANLHRDQYWAEKTGRKAQRARRRMRERSAEQLNGGNDG